MTERLLDRIASLTLRRPALVLATIAALTAAFALNARRLELQTDITDLLGGSTPEARVMREFVRDFGYGNRLFVVVETGGDGEDDAERMEVAADELVEAMGGSGLFTQARAGLSEAEMLQLGAYWVRNLPSFADPARRDELARRLSPEGIRAHVRETAGGLLSPFSTMGPEYFRLDPLGLLEFADPVTREAGGFSGLDLTWGSGGRFFSRDHRALLVMAEPRQPATDYESAVQLMGWLRARLEELRARGEGGDLQLTPVGAHVYAQENRASIERDIRVASTLSIGGNLLLAAVVYRWLPPLVLTAVPTALSLLWTTGLIAAYPGIVNLISLAFIAIIAGLGDDQATYVLTRVPQGMAGGQSLARALKATYVTTGKSVLFCTLTSATGALALALTRTRALADLGLMLTVGLVMLMVHTLLTVPALLYAWWRRFPPARPEGGPFRLLPCVARSTGALVAGRPRLVLAAGVGLLLVACAGPPTLRVSNQLESLAAYDAPAFVGQRLLASRFGMEGTPTVLLVEGDEQDVLQRAGDLEAALEPVRRRGEVRAVTGPGSLVPSLAQQRQRARALAGLDFRAAADALERALLENGLDPRAFGAATGHLREWAAGRWPSIDLDEARRSLPDGLLDTSIRRLPSGRCLGAVTLSSASIEASARLSASTMWYLRQSAGPFVEFSYDRIAGDLQKRIVEDGGAASLGTLAVVGLIVAVLFRDLRTSLLVLLPIAYGIVATVGLLALGGHRFSGMAFAAIPLIVGIGIDNAIHLVRRHQEMPRASTRELLAASGPALVQTNLTTIVGFGALLTARFAPLVELGLTMAVGMAMTLFASLMLVPAVLELRRKAAPDQALESPRSAAAG